MCSGQKLKKKIKSYKVFMNTSKISRFKFSKKFVRYQNANLHLLLSNKHSLNHNKKHSKSKNKNPK